MKKKLLLWTALIIGLAACDQTPPATGIDSITAEDLHAKIKILASDEFQGRAPSSPGEEITVAYIRDEFIKYGLEPGNNGSWYQDVPLVDITADANQTLTFSGGEGEDISLTYMDDYVALTRRVVEDINIAGSEMVFVGYGIVAPEYGWDDYAGVDMAGKTAVMLVNDPGYATQNDDMFTGNAMTIYGRWTYKYEEAAKQGADAVIIIHETGAAGYPSNTDIFRLAREQGGLGAYVHPFFGDEDPLKGNLGGAKSFPVDVALETVDYHELVSGAGWAAYDVWHKALNNGFNVPAVGGEDAISGLHQTAIIGQMRAYGYMGDGLSWDGWVDAIRNGTLFVTNGLIPEKLLFV